MSFTRLILIRHAHAAGNGWDGTLLGGRTDAPLSTRGREQLHRLQTRLRGTSPFATIYSSPLLRAHGTATALDQVGLGPVRLCPALQEIDCGDLDGMSLDHIKRGHPRLWDAHLHQADEDFRWAGGESYRQFRSRCLRAVRTVAAAHRGAQVALVTHAGVVNQLLGFLAGVSAAAWEPFRPGNTAITAVEWRRGSGTVVAFDDRSHLPLEWR